MWVYDIEAIDVVLFVLYFDSLVHPLAPPDSYETKRTQLSLDIRISNISTQMTTNFDMFLTPYQNSTLFNVPFRGCD